MFSADLSTLACANENDKSGDCPRCCTLFRDRALIDDSIDELLAGDCAFKCSELSSNFAARNLFVFGSSLREPKTLASSQARHFCAFHSLRKQAIKIAILPFSVFFFARFANSEVCKLRFASSKSEKSANTKS